VVGPERAPRQGVRVDQPTPLVDLVERFFEDDRALRLQLQKARRAEHAAEQVGGVL